MGNSFLQNILPFSILAFTSGFKLVRLFSFLFITIILLYCDQPNPNQSGEKIKRIVSLSPHITEILYALEQQDKLIAVTAFCSYPPEAVQKEHIGGLLNPNMERLLSLKADLFIGTPAHAELATKLSRQNLRSVLLPNDRLQDVFTTIDSLGKLLSCTRQADRLKSVIQDSLRYYQKRSSQIPGAKRALFVIGREPGQTVKITAAGPGTFIDDVWRLLGGLNAFSDLPVKYSQINREALLRKNPDLIIEFKFKQKWDEERERQNRLEWQIMQNLNAVKHNQIFVLTGDHTLIPGPRIYLLARDYYTILKQIKNTP